MRIIEHNPYRILGLLAGSTSKEQHRQITRLGHFIAAEQEPPIDYSFPELGKVTNMLFPELYKLTRTLESVEEASSKLNLDADKMFFALFWFYKGNEIIDEPAFELLQQGEIWDAASIWAKITISSDVSAKNASAFQNLSTLMLYCSFQEKYHSVASLEKGVQLKLKFLESDFARDFKEKITDETYQTTKRKLQLMFLDQVLTEIEQSNKDLLYQFIKIVKEQSFIAKVDFLNSLVQKLTDKIESKISEAKTKRKTNTANAINAGIELYQMSELQVLIDFLCGNNFKFSTLLDKVALEILQCGIDFFNYWKDNDYDCIPEEHLQYTGNEEDENFPEQVRDLFNEALALAQSDYVKERCSENIKCIQEWIDTKPERDKLKKVNNEINYISDQLQKFQNQSDSITNALNFANNCKPHLSTMKSTLGIDNELYMALSTAVASNALGMIVATVNEAQVKRNAYVEYLYWQNDPTKNALFYAPKNNSDPFVWKKNAPPQAPEYTLWDLQKVITEAWSATIALGEFDMSSEQRSHYEKNKESLKNLCSQSGIDNSTKEIRKTKKKSSNGCIISAIVGLLIFVSIIIILDQLNNEKEGNFFSIPDSDTETKAFLKDRLDTRKATEWEINNKETVKRNYWEDFYKKSRPSNGANVYDFFYGKGVFDRSSLCEVTIKNGTSTDAVVIYKNVVTDKVIRNLYVRAGENFTAKEIPEGTYEMKCYYGNVWNPSKDNGSNKPIGGFLYDESYSAATSSDDYFDFERINTQNGYSYSTYEVTLHKVRDGNLHTKPTTLDYFFN